MSVATERDNVSFIVSLLLQLKNVDIYNIVLRVWHISWIAFTRYVTVIAFTRYVQSQKIGKLNNLKVITLNTQSDLSISFTHIYWSKIHNTCIIVKFICIWVIHTCTWIKHLCIWVIYTCTWVNSTLYMNAIFWLVDKRGIFYQFCFFWFFPIAGVFFSGNSV